MPRGAGSSLSGGAEADGGDSPAWSHKREPYRPPPEMVAAAGPRVPYAELHCPSNLSLLDGARHPEELGERIVRRFLVVWDHTGGGRSLAALVRSIANHETAAALMRQFVTRVIVRRIVATVAPDRLDLRAGLVASQLVGLGMVRYVLRLEPLASADHATVVAAIAPTVQRYLTGSLDGPGWRS